MKSTSSLLIVLAVVALTISACSPAKVIPAQTLPTLAPVNFSTPNPLATPAPTVTAIPTATPTLSAGDAAIEAAWAIQKPKIDAKISSVFNSSVTNPWLSPVFDPAGLVIPESPMAHCLAMSIWEGYIPLQNPLPGCMSGHDPLQDYFGIETSPLESIGKDSLVMKVFPFMPIPTCDGVHPCGLLPMGVGAYYGMRIGSKYKIVTFCGKPTIPAQKGSLIQLLPYLKDPVSMLLLSTDGRGYLEIVANRDSYFSFGWTESGKGWEETFKFCPT
jgi:hypothetical protein